ncbi:MAG: energy transducer TonB [Micropepsaceae bacterium]
MDRRSVYITIIVSVLLHIGLLYYIAVTWGIIPTEMEEKPDEVIAVTVPPPPPPPPPPPEEVVIEKPRFRPRPVPPPPVAVKVPPIPLKPQPPAESTSDATTILSDRQVIDSPVSKPPCRYPKRAEDAEKEGVVKLLITIRPDGSVSDIEVVSAVPPGWFEEASRACVARYRYRASGRAIKAPIEITWRLE